MFILILFVTIFVGSDGKDEDGRRERNAFSYSIMFSKCKLILAVIANLISVNMLRPSAAHNQTPSFDLIC